MEKQKANITLYTFIAHTEKIVDAMKQHFEDLSIKMEEGDGSLKVTLFDETEVWMIQKKDQDGVSQQIHGMMHYFSQAPCENKALMEQVMVQISMFTCISGFGFEIDDQNDRTNAIIGRIYAIARDTASIVLYPDMSLYTPKGELLLSMEGNSDLKEFRPIAYTDIVNEQVEYEEEDHQRFEAIVKEIKEKGYPCRTGIMSSQLTKAQLQIPDKETIVKRAISVFACAVCAEGTLMEDGSREIGLKEFEAIDKIFGCREYLSEKEKEFIEAQEVEDSISVQFSWRYECCAVLLWALHLYELNDNDSICDVASMAQTIRGFASLKDMCEASMVRSEEELLDMQTRALYYDWSCVEARIHQQELKGINDGVVQEHHYALNWLTVANKTENWDKIQCHT